MRPDVQLFDSHCHLQDEAFAGDREAVWARARALGVGMVLAAWSEASAQAGVAFAESHADTWALVGIHPHEARQCPPDWGEKVAQWMASPRVVGVGEIGLDFYYRHSPPEDQVAVFQAQLRWARELGRPVSIHSREAEAETVRCLDAVPGVRGVLHCFTGSAEFAEALLARGFYLSFSGIVTFPKAEALRAVLRRVPLDRILVETDAPYLTPTPWRGQRNEPARVVRVAEVVAAEKNCSPEEVFSQVVENTLRVFPLF
ncbi:MAG: TatD family hydrolase [Firmicutes bacterium]|nr:TatD family hydrolase [Alicyclobacillaceae bacterium]MCL6497227.1 TatD family hydrolase [Bacillota bacterium]